MQEAADSTYSALFFPDSIAGATLCRIDDAPVTAVSRLSFTTTRVPYSSGLIPQERAQLPGYDSVVVCVLLAVFMLLSLNFRHYSNFFKTLPTALLDVKKRQNAFDESHTFSEFRAGISLMLVCMICEGIVIYSLIRPVMTLNLSIVMGIIVCTLVAVALFTFRLLAYISAGYIFTTPEMAVQWVRGFTSGQALLGLLLVLPALWVLYNPGVAFTIGIISAICVVGVTGIFICKGFRIFYTNFFSLIYFILYLCTLELAPLAVALRALRCL